MKPNPSLKNPMVFGHLGLLFNYAIRSSFNSWRRGTLYHSFAFRIWPSFIFLRSWVIILLFVDIFYPSSTSSVKWFFDLLIVYLWTFPHVAVLSSPLTSKNVGVTMWWYTDPLTEVFVFRPSVPSSLLGECSNTLTSQVSAKDFVKEYFGSDENGTSKRQDDDPWRGSLHFCGLVLGSCGYKYHRNKS